VPDATTGSSTTVSADSTAARTATSGALREAAEVVLLPARAGARTERIAAMADIVEWWEGGCGRGWRERWCLEKAREGEEVLDRRGFVRRRTKTEGELE